MHIKTCNANIPNDKKARVVKAISAISLRLISLVCFIGEEEIGDSGGV